MPVSRAAAVPARGDRPQGEPGVSSGGGVAISALREEFIRLSDAAGYPASSILAARGSLARSKRGAHNAVIESSNLSPATNLEPELDSSHPYGGWSVESHLGAINDPLYTGESGRSRAGTPLPSRREQVEMNDAIRTRGGASRAMAARGERGYADMSDPRVLVCPDCGATLTVTEYHAAEYTTLTIDHGRAQVVRQAIESAIVQVTDSADRFKNNGAHNDADR